ncbi:MAG: hypothetical protein ABJC12_09840 [Saprospiraceae bacterium]
MDFKATFSNTNTISKISTIILFMALIRCISEPFRLQYYSDTILSFAEIKLFLYGALIAATGLLIITVLSYFRKNNFIIATSIITIAGLFLLKIIYVRT